MSESSNTSIRYDVSLIMRLVRATPVVGAYLGIVAVVLVLLPKDAQRLSIESVAMIGLIGMWRYLWMLTHVVRAVIYEHFVYPKIRFEADSLPEEEKFPERVYFLVPSWKEKPEVSERSLSSLLDESASIPSKVTIIINAGSEEEDDIFRRAHARHKNRDAAELIFIRQAGGKRQGMADVLMEMSTFEIDENDVIALMDGDTLLGDGILKKCLPLFRLRPKLGALTTDNIAVTTGNWFYRKWYTLRFAMRHRMMKSQSLSKQLLVLTGRFSLFRAHLAVQPDFINLLENDRIKHWLHGEIKFVTGDDKSTWYSLLKRGCEMLYVPDAHIFCMEDSGKKPFLQSIQKMHRWFGNMLRNNGRAIRLGMGAQKPFIWLCLVDQRISMFTSLLGPIAAIWAALWLSWHYLIIYLLIVILVRTLYLLMLMVEGHRLAIFDIPMLLYTQWVGSIVKIFTMFHLHKQKWDNHRSNMDNSKSGVSLMIEVIPKMQVVLSLIILIAFVAVMVGFKNN